jgi:pilus assembly protein CpaB
MGRWKALIPIALALMIAMGGSMFLYRWLQLKTTSPEVVKKGEAAIVNVVVAAVDLPWGAKLQKEMLKTVPYLRESLPNGFQSDLALLEGRVVVSPIQATEAVLESRLAPTSVTIGGVSAVIKTGMRAIAVKGDKVIGISGFIQPGNRVDVLVTLKDPDTDSETTKMVLSNVLVLATGTEIQEKKDGKPGPVDVFTLEVDPEQGEKLALSAAEGKLQFALRNTMDTGTVFTKGATASETLASLREAEPRVETPVKAREWQPRPRGTTVETIKGDKVGKQEFNL